MGEDAVGGRDRQARVALEEPKGPTLRKRGWGTRKVKGATQGALALKESTEEKIMAKVVLGVGSSHGPMLSTPPDMWHLRAGADRKNPKHFYRGQAYDFDKLLAERQPGFAAAITHGGEAEALRCVPARAG